jgi:uncharacterized membrane protein
VIFDLIFVGLFVAGWLICGYLPWLARSIATRGEAGLRYLPLCLLAAVVTGLAIPIVGFDGMPGLIASFVAAAVVPAILLAVAPGKRSPG